MRHLDFQMETAVRRAEILVRNSYTLPLLPHGFIDALRISVSP